MFVMFKLQKMSFVYLLAYYAQPLTHNTSKAMKSQAFTEPIDA